MSHVLRRPGPALFALLLLAAAPPGAALQKAASPPAPPVLPAPPAPPAPPDIDIDIEPEDVDVDVEERDPALVTIVRRPHVYIGLRLLDLTPELRQLYTGSADAGVLVASVEAESPAAKAEIRVGDVITKVGGELVSRPSEVSRAVRRKESGQKVTLELRRDKAVRTVDVVVAGRTGSRHEIRMPGFRVPDFSFQTHDWDERISERVEEALERTREKLRQLEERLKELERRMKAK